MDSDLYAEYSSVRGSHALTIDQLLEIDASSSNQPCGTFGINSAIPILKQLYDDDEALFFANSGLLQRSVNKQDWESTSSRLFAHNTQQWEAMKVDIQKEMGDTGVAGRLLDVLGKSGLYRTAATSVDSSSSTVLQGGVMYNNPITGIPRKNPAAFNYQPSLDGMDDIIAQLNDKSPLNSGMYGDTWSENLIKAIADNENIVSVYSNQDFFVENFPDNSKLSEKFQAVAQWMKARDHRNVNREVFFVEYGGWDHHTTSDTNNLQVKLGEVDAALAAFKKEMKNQGTWQDVVVVAVSDFGRTLTPNASPGGTDHGWVSTTKMFVNRLKLEFRLILNVTNYRAETIS